jgi:hypothetical protein
MCERASLETMAISQKFMIIYPLDPFYFFHGVLAISIWWMVFLYGFVFPPSLDTAG